MARLSRLTIPSFPHHLVQRGNNRQPTFHEAADYELLLKLLAEHAQREKVAIHAYVLMGNHFHLLATPETLTGLPRMMQAVGRRYVQYFNRRYQRTGTLWEGRYKATLVQTERYLLACMAYIDLNPVRAGLVREAKDYIWSSHGHYIGQRDDKIVSTHSLFWALGNTPFAREAAYADLVQAGVTPAQQADLTRSALNGWALGEERFVRDLQKRTARRVVKGQAGRPTLPKENRTAEPKA